METSKTFFKNTTIDNPKVLMEDIKQWLIHQEIISSKEQPLELEAPNTYYGGINYKNIIEEEGFYGKVEFVAKRTEIMHRVGWDWGVDFLLPDVVLCPQCKKDLIKGIDPATFYGENNLEQDPNGIRILQELRAGISLWESNEEVNITCYNCGVQNLIEEYDYNNSLIFTNFAIIFWNWPKLKPEFKNTLINKLGVDTTLFIDM
ncbi:hypothetical protein [uncultured Aquimarina sp.]|uniref:hypothetical protein n=1 Tax=uncultured Aquimarina sp. TaxID=575652 RepID=UPI0026322DCD|nr:hypothetical protein [uncultured Aquimarina sp.]